MSIYTSLHAPNDLHADTCAVYREDPDDPGTLEWSGEPCDCGLPDLRGRGPRGAQGERAALRGARALPVRARPAASLVGRGARLAGWLYVMGDRRA